MRKKMIRHYQDKDWERLNVIHDTARQIELANAGLSEAYLTLAETYENEGLFEYELLVSENDQGVVTGFVAFNSDEIAWLYVEPKYHRQGIASDLLEAAMGQCGEEIGIEVLGNNTGALELYQKKGFVVVESVSGKMPGNESFDVTCEV